MPTATHPVSFLFRQPRSTDDLDADVIKEGSSPETASNLQRSLQIDMKGLFGDAVGNVCLSILARAMILTISGFSDEYQSNKSRFGSGSVSLSTIQAFPRCAC